MAADRPPLGGQQSTATPPAGIHVLQDPITAGAVRRLVRETLDARPGPYSAQAVGDAMLAASELATNAIVHGGGITRCQVQLVPLGLEVAISDAAPGLPHLAEQPADRSVGGGFGWRLIQKLALRVTVTPLEPGPDGKPRGKTIAVAMPLY
jgi:anti-sigma regulatory factor (Ser/Thr protein kinase)